jgi:hypothetical protein
MTTRSLSAQQTTKDKQKGNKKKNQLPPVEQKQQPTQTEDILNSVLPPQGASREWTEDGQLWVLGVIYTICIKHEVYEVHPGHKPPGLMSSASKSNNSITQQLCATPQQRQRQDAKSKEKGAKPSTRGNNEFPCSWE